MRRFELLHCYIAQLLDWKGRLNTSYSLSVNDLAIKRFNYGFTLVELLVVMGILGTITGASLLFLTNILKGSNQARIVSEVKQNGQTVLDVIDRQIRNAVAVDEFVPPPPTGASSVIRLTVLLSSGGTSYIYLACFNADMGSTPKKNGWIGIINSASAVPPATGLLSLTNQDPNSGINIECTPSPTFDVLGSSTDSYPQVVQVSFNAKQGVEAPGRVDFDASAEFKTTISLRKYSF